MRKILLAVIFVICFSGLANAQNNWVLWVGRDKNIGSDTIWTIESAFPSYELCTDRIKNICAGTGSMDYSSYTCTKFNYLGYRAWYYRCFPDTVDPRK